MTGPTDIEVVRALIDMSKTRAAEQDAMVVSVDLGAVKVPVKRSRPRNEAPDKEPIDPSNVYVLSPNERAYVPALIGRLIELRAEKRKLNTEEDAIKDVLLAQVGELEYVALAEDDKPLISIKHEERTSVNTQWVQEHLPRDEHPEAYRRSQSRPLRIID